MTIADSYHRLLQEIEDRAAACGRDPATLVVVTKNQPLENILEVYEAGCRDFGESKVQEAAEKIPHLPADIRWHMIGSIQSKKAGKVVDDYALLHSIDSLKLAREIAKRAKQPLPILLQVNTSGEEAKHGLSPQEIQEQLPLFLALAPLHVQGLMTMAPFTQEEKPIRDAFRSLKTLRDRLQDTYNHPLPALSMGMSNDYPIAIEEGTTHLRIGTHLFTRS